MAFEISRRRAGRREEEKSQSVGRQEAGMKPGEEEGEGEGGRGKGRRLRAGQGQTHGGQEGVAATGSRMWVETLHIRSASPPSDQSSLNLYYRMFTPFGYHTSAIRRVPLSSHK